MLTQNRILILSPQDWGRMFLSKHHYAVELAKKGNQVFFLNPPDNKLDRPVVIESVPDLPGLHIIRHKLPFSYNLKFHAIGLFHWLMKFHIKRIVRTIGGKLDIVWSFDLGNIYPLSFFKEIPIRVFHPVDEPLNDSAINSASGASIILSVTNEILDKYKKFDVPKYMVNHGLSDSFLNCPGNIQEDDGLTRIGFSGNLLRKDIDRPVFLQIVQSHPDVIFECWGSYRKQEANLGSNDDLDTAEFIANLQRQPNIVLHGVVSTKELCMSYQRMHGFLICYDINRDQSKGTNYHKIIEYLSTGKVIVSNNVTAYLGRQDLVEMCKGRNDNSELPGLFKSVIANLDYYNSAEKRLARKAFAEKNKYSDHIVTIAGLLNSQ